MKALGKLVGIHKSTVANYESDFRHPPIATLHKIAEVLNTSTDYLLGLNTNETLQYYEDKAINMRELLQKGDLHWNGVPLTEEDTRFIHHFFEYLINERIAANPLRSSNIIALE